MIISIVSSRFPVVIDDNERAFVTRHIDDEDNEGHEEVEVFRVGCGVLRRVDVARCRVSLGALWDARFADAGRVEVERGFARRGCHARGARHD